MDNYAHSIPGLLQATRYSDEDPMFYDAGAKRFKDLAGYGPANDLRVILGTPVFETVNGRRSAKLDNTWHAYRHAAAPWRGTRIVALRPNFIAGATITKFIELYGDAVSVASNGQFCVTHSSGARQVKVNGPNGSLSRLESRTDNNAVVLAFAYDQETRKYYSSKDGITVNETTAFAGTTDGNAPALRCARYGVRFGNLSGTAGDLTAETAMPINMLEDATWGVNLLAGPNAQPAKVQALIAYWKSYYAAS